MKKTRADIEAVCRRATQMNEENLQKLLLDNADTVFGKRYAFSRIQSVRDYITRVPFTEYEDLKPYVERMIAGEKNVLTSYDLAGFCLTSGTLGGRKYIPVSEEAFARYSDYIEFYKNEIHQEAKGMRLFINGFRIPADPEKRRGNLLSEMYYQYLFYHGYLSFEDYAGGEELLFDQTGRDVIYAKIWMAFVLEDITVLESIFLYDQLLFFQYMEKNWQDILRHIRTGAIPEEILLPEHVRTYLSGVPFSEERLRKVEKECRKGFDAIAGRLFPSLVLASGIGNPAFNIEESRLREYLGDIPVYYFSYAASECHMGVALEKEDCSYVMLPGSAFYEYLPWEEDNAKPSGSTSETLLPQETQVGKCYEVILTNFSGLYRYRIGDIVRVISFCNESPVVEFLFRKNQMLNIAGEKMGIRQVKQAMEELRSEYGFPVQEYCIAGLIEMYPARYGCAISSEALFSEDQEKLLADWLDASLKRQNVDYEDIRGLGYLGRPKVLLLHPEDFSFFLKENSINLGHNKPHHTAPVFKDAVWKKWREGYEF